MHTSPSLICFMVKNRIQFLYKMQGLLVLICLRKNGPGASAAKIIFLSFLWPIPVLTGYGTWKHLLISEVLNRPRRAKTCLWAFADSEGPDQTVQMHSLIRVFPVRKQKHLII